jgi:hypothetical protein
MHSTWMPIETAPKDGTRILAAAPGHLTMIASWSGHGRYFGPAWYSNNVAITPSPTHWLPLPVYERAGPLSETEQKAGFEFTIKFSCDRDQVPGWGHQIEDWIALATREFLLAKHYNTRAEVVEILEPRPCIVTSHEFPPIGQMLFVDVVQQ